jgi:hypothetical protein
MIGQEEKRARVIAPQQTHHTNQQQQQPWSAEEAATATPCSKTSCGKKMYALSFIIPASAVAALYLPDAINSGNCALATIPAVLAGTTAFGLYRLCKFIKHSR